MNMFQYMDSNPYNTFFLAVFIMITVCAVSSHVWEALGILFSRINAGKDTVVVAKED